MVPILVYLLISWQKHLEPCSVRYFWLKSINFCNHWRDVSIAKLKAIRDIWRSSAERFGDRVALVDAHHDLPTNMTYNQLEEDILNFEEGLRVIGIKPCEKVLLFADNSCRWLVADQGIMATGAINIVRGSRSSIEELLHIYTHSESVALAVDNPEFYHRIATRFNSKASVR
ncbi:unnamed protein product [Lactuca virosa]|uniref:AMP-dependent synthetase/ligase domain-containing protein n=1 Tax=Lactuca virosa TaxID=75947 RepID=A0AAU9N8W8_9ASTR|nr:unnamed protein product [Lactuca virosa]